MSPVSAVTTSPVIVALDFTTSHDALALVDRLPAGSCRLKVGKELFTHTGPQLVRDLQTRGFDVFLDLKFHDIPNTVAGAVAAAADLGVWMVNVHASGGRRMLEAARETLARHQHRTLLTAVTVLTSMTSEELAETGCVDDARSQVLRLARLASDSGLDGVVCSAQEAVMLREQLPASFQLVTPGIRPAGSAGDDQRRIMTPVEAVAAGVNYLVIGRPITQAADPVQALIDINRSLGVV
ncbi:orotidine-5'-phosphate decarboxylase [Perlucidibaca piscinae]|uniref:orotidine-5'-phosphate decarboxylase n=1 Tax=Perlucidibaca piscinae TaxID=392589 RepID=UPI0003B4F038|nr:orotidine-5'-phosphate decarboxylase [Perlucidibaca piscinae]